MTQAKNIPDAALLAAVRSVRRPWGTSHRWDVEAALPEFPPKVVLAKLRSAVRRKILNGCGCGCRGDFTEA